MREKFWVEKALGSMWNPGKVWLYETQKFCSLEPSGQRPR